MKVQTYVTDLDVGRTLVGLLLVFPSFLPGYRTLLDHKDYGSNWCLRC